MQFEKKSIADAFSKAAKHYDQAAILQRQVGQQLLSDVKTQAIHANVVLDLGCGPGHFTFLLGQHFPYAKVFGVDLAPGMLEVAKQYALPNLGWYCADADQLPFSNQSVDIIFTNLMLQWSNNLNLTFKEMYRVLKPGGWIFFTTFGKDTLQELRKAWQLIDQWDHVHQFMSFSDLQTIIKQFNFDQFKCEVSHITRYYDDVISLMRELKQVGAHNQASHRNPALMGKKQWQQMLMHYEKQCNAEGFVPTTYEIYWGRLKK